MGEHSKIEWTDHTFNPWEGCTKVSPGCAHCYAETRNQRFAGGANWGPGAPRRRTVPSNWSKPRKWNQMAGGLACTKCAEVFAPPAWAYIGDVLAGACPLCGGKFSVRKARVFCASLADWLDDEVPIEWLVDLLDLIRTTPNLDWLLLSKRPQNWMHRIDHAGTSIADNKDLYEWIQAWQCGYAPSQIWIGTTVEDQQRADERIPQLLSIPARVRFLSCEPLLGPVILPAEITRERSVGPGHDVTKVTSLSNWIHWVIAGGESGPGARPMHPDWARWLRGQCAAAGVPFFYKQWGEWLPDSQRLFATWNPITWGIVHESGAFRCPIKKGVRDFALSVKLEPHEAGTSLVGKHTAGRTLDGCEHNEFPK